MKLYTLQQCYEECGSKFPFIISYYYKGTIYKDITIISKDGNCWRCEPYFQDGPKWWGIGGKSLLFEYFEGTLELFDHTSYKYKQDFDKIIND